MNGRDANPVSVKTTNVRTRRKPVSENASAEEVAADVAREKAAKQKGAQKCCREASLPQGKSGRGAGKNSAQKQLRRAQESLLQPVHGAAVMIHMRVMKKMNPAWMRTRLRVPMP